MLIAHDWCHFDNFRPWHTFRSAMGMFKLKTALQKITDKYHHGLEYELKARTYLEEQGYAILAQNVRFRFGEIDIIAEKNQTLVFVEVRKRDLLSALAPEESLSHKKVLRLRNAIYAYLSKYRNPSCNDQVRIDLIAFTGEKLRHFEDFI